MDSRTNKSMSFDTNNDNDVDYDFYLRRFDIPLNQIRQALKYKDKTDEDIEKIVNKIEKERTNILKFTDKFIRKYSEHIGDHNIPKLIKAAAKWAEKKKLTKTQRDIIVQRVLKGDDNKISQYSHFFDIQNTQMAKFMGLPYQQQQLGQVLKLDTSDLPVLDEILKLYDTTRELHKSIKQQAIYRKDCDAKTILGGYDKRKDNVGNHIHPLIAAFFVPRLEAFERRTLFTNIGRIVNQRSYAHSGRSPHNNYDIMKGELEADFEFVNAIANDPNSLIYFSDDKPITNLLKRFKAQIALWHNVFNLRNGKYYGSSYSMSTSDPISGLTNILREYSWSFYDSPDMYYVQDTGSLLRKMLAVFAFRPTWVQLTTMPAASGMMFATNAMIGKQVMKYEFVTIPVVNIRLPQKINKTGLFGMTHQSVGPKKLSDALKSTDYFYEKKGIVPKEREVIFSNDMIIFYCNRTIQTTSVGNKTINFSYMNPLMKVSPFELNYSDVNDCELGVDQELQIGNDLFTLRSYVSLYKPLVEGVYSMDTRAVILKQVQGQNGYISYNPSIAGNYIEFSENLDNVPEEVGPFTLMNEVSGNDNGNDFASTSSKYGIVYIYHRVGFENGDSQENQFMF